MKISLFTATLPSAGYQDKQSIIDFNEMMNDVGYFSALFVYHSKSIDYLLPIIRHLDTSHSFKYLIAMRTYAISPEYCSMLVDSFNSIAPGRLALNIVAGDLHSEENSVNDVVDIQDSINTTLKRTEYTARWLEKFINIMGNRRPYLVISGYSDVTNKNAEKYADEQLLMLSTYKKEMNGKILSPGVMVSAPVYFLNDENKYDTKLIEDLKKNNRMMYESSIIGSEKEVYEKIKRLSDIGVTNCMVSVLFADQEEKLHIVMKKLIKDLKNEKK